MAPLVSTGAACGLSAPSSLADVGLLLHAQLSCHRERQLKQQLAGCSGDGKWQGTAQPWQRLLWVLPPQLCLAPRPSQANVRVAAGAASTLGVCQLFASSWVPAQGGTRGRNVPSAHSVCRCISLLDVTQMQANAYKHRMWEERVLYLFVTALVNFQEV